MNGSSIEADFSKNSLNGGRNTQKEDGINFPVVERDPHAKNQKKHKYHSDITMIGESILHQGKYVEHIPLDGDGEIDSTQYGINSGHSIFFDYGRSVPLAREGLRQALLDLKKKFPQLSIQIEEKDSQLVVLMEVQKIQVGSIVQWCPGGVKQFVAPRRVRTITEDGFAFVEGSNTGLPIDELYTETL